MDDIDILNRKSKHDKPEKQKLTPLRRFSNPLSLTLQPNVNSPLSGICDDESERRIRIAKTIGAQYNRLSKHISSFIYIIVILEDMKFGMTVDKTNTIEYLVKQIEAEYTFKFLLKDTDDKEKLVTLECGGICDSNMIPLRFSDIIGDVIGMGDEIYCLNVFKVNTPIRPKFNFDKKDIDLESCNSIGRTDSFDFDNIIDKKKQLTDEDDERFTFKSIQSSKSDELLSKILSNKIGLQYFLNYCIKELVVEDVLFWLDVECFQTIEPKLKELYISFLIITYIVDGAPLKINISDELRNNFFIQYSENPLSNELFDEIHEEIYSTIQCFHYAKFEKSKLFESLINTRRKDIEKYNNFNLKNVFDESFPHDIHFLIKTVHKYKNVIKALKSKKLKNLTLSSEDSSKYLYNVVIVYLPVINEKLIENYFLEKEKVRKIQKKVKREKEKKLANFFGENPSVDPIKKQIFSITMNLNIKDSALHNSSKLIINQGLIYNNDDAESSNERLNKSSQILYDDSCSELDKSQYLSSDDVFSLKQYYLKDIDDNEIDKKSNEDFKSSSIFTMKKKADKLQHFFGDKIQISQLNEQQALQNEIGENNGLNTIKLNRKSSSVDYLSNINNLFNSKGTIKFGKMSISNEELPKTENLMDNSIRKMMTKRTNKINSILGTVIDEKLTGSVIDAAQSTNSRKELNDEININKSRSFVDLAVDSTNCNDLNDNNSENEELDSNADLNKGNMTQIRRMKKLHQVFGERINLETLIKLKIKRNEIEKRNKIEKGIFTEYERKDIRNRCKKLENIFGAIPPTLLVNSNSTGNTIKSSVNNAFIQHRNSIISLSMMFAYDKEIADVMDIVSTECDKENTASTDGDENENSKDVHKAKLKKLRKFFGDDTDPASIINSIIISDLRKSIERDITDKDQKKQLNNELNIIWEDIQEKSKHYMDSIEEEDSSFNDASESILKVSQSFKKYRSFGKQKNKKTLSSNTLKSLCENSDSECDSDGCDSQWKDYVIDWLKSNHKI